MMGGFVGAGEPTCCIDWLIEHGITDITLLTNEPGLDGFGRAMLYKNGRVKELINRGGEKISAAEIETCILDMPGVLWPKFEDQTVGLRLALIGSIKDEVLQTEELAAELIRFLAANYPGVLENKYTITAAPDPYVMLGRIAESRHCLVRGNELDTEKAAMLLMDDFREGKLGRLTLEYPQTEEA